jgi:Putative endonuclease segE, GIY-YIG domain
MDWELKEDFKIDDWEGFVYKITNITNGRMYIGQKRFWSSKLSYKKNPKTGIKKRIRSRVESDWKKYYGSSEELKNDIASIGVENFKREILHFCKSKGMMNYMELKEQMDRNVLIDLTYYNSFVGGKIHRKHVKING